MRNRFDRQLLRLNQEMIDMGSLCEEMITAAAKIVATRDKELMDDIVTMEEIRKALEATYPEYSKERTSMTYDKRHFIIAMLKSSTKGATIVSSREGFHREVNENGVTEYRPYGKFVLTGKISWIFL